MSQQIAFNPLTGKFDIVDVFDGTAAGGDLSGTYPNPSVTDDSHNHSSSTLSGVQRIIVDTKANILARTGDATGQEYFASDTFEVFRHVGSNVYYKVPFALVLDTASPDMGYTDSSRIGINPASASGDGSITDYVISNSAIGSNANTANASGTRIPIRAYNSTLQIYVSGAWQTIVSNFVFREDSTWGYALEHAPVGFTYYIEIMAGMSLNNLGLNGLPIIQGYQASMGAYPAVQVVGGRTIS